METGRVVEAYPEHAAPLCAAVRQGNDHPSDRRPIRSGNHLGSPGPRFRDALASGDARSDGGRRCRAASLNFPTRDTGACGSAEMRVRQITGYGEIQGSRGSLQSEYFRQVFFLRLGRREIQAVPYSIQVFDHLNFGRIRIAPLNRTQNVRMLVRRAHGVT